MGKLIDLTGQKFGRLTVIGRTDKKKNNDILWHCKCDCGQEVDVRGFFLRSGQTKSCGCYKHDVNINKKSPILIDLTGQKFGHWTVLERAANDKHRASRWLCECDCSAHTKRIVAGASLRKGTSISCGCERRSHGELKIADILYKNNIPFIQEYRPFKFSTGSYASFDFYIGNKYLLEFDGIQHFSANHGWNTEDNLSKVQERDMIKNQWCKDNNIPLIRIPYTHLNDLCLDDLKLETSKFII
jgi:hypothetical protein